MSLCVGGGHSDVTGAGGEAVRLRKAVHTQASEHLCIPLPGAVRWCSGDDWESKSEPLFSHVPCNPVCHRDIDSSRLMGDGMGDGSVKGPRSQGLLDVVPLHPWTAWLSLYGDTV